MKYETYPMWMNHPSMQPAVVSEDPRKSRPLTFGPVLVHNLQSQEEYEARGYEPGVKANPRAFEAVFADRDLDHETVGFQEYPKWVATGDFDRDGNPVGRIFPDQESHDAALGIRPKKRQKEPAAEGRQKEAIS